jgi:hypothetical protein
MVGGFQQAFVAAIVGIRQCRMSIEHRIVEERDHVTSPLTAPEG